LESLRILREKKFSSDLDQIDEENMVTEPYGTDTGLILVI